MIILNLDSCDKRWLSRLLQITKDAGVRRRCAIVLDLAENFGVTQTARRERVARTTVYRVANQFLRGGVATLFDARASNGRTKADEDFEAELVELVMDCPLDYGWPRPTWTQELLILAMEKTTGVRVSRATMSRSLKEIGARLGRPKPVVYCPWEAEKRDERLAELALLPAELPATDRLVYADEVDLHLNPKIGPDWMMSGQQKIVITPGKNEKRYAAGALDANTGELVCEYADKKTSVVFVTLLWTLFRELKPLQHVHIILDNYVIHKSKIVATAMEAFGGRVVLHFLPPYCPQGNRIERVWQDLHANVTRNHRCRTIEQLSNNVKEWIDERNERARTNHNGRHASQPIISAVPVVPARS